MGDLTTSLGGEMDLQQAESLVVRLKENDEQAFAEAFELYKDMVYNLACKLLTDKSDALDITQEVFLVLFRKIHRFRGECSLKTWLYRITLNQAANRNRWWRRRRRHRTRPLSLGLRDEHDNGFEPAGKNPSPQRLILSRETKEALERGLEKLPFEQRSAVILRDVQHLSYQEISQVTGAQVGTVKSRIARGRERLREILREHYPSGESR